LALMSLMEPVGSTLYTREVEAILEPELIVPKDEPQETAKAKPKKRRKKRKVKRKVAVSQQETLAHSTVQCYAP